MLRYNDNAGALSIDIQSNVEPCNIAIQVREACKHYGSKNNVTQVLDHLNLTVQKRPYICTFRCKRFRKNYLTKLPCRKQKLNSGNIQVLGTTPGEEGSVCPGPRVGYMPQENALYQEITIRETMKYFGWIAGLSTTEILKRLNVIVQLLLIPNLDQQIKNLSGGEQRRISFAVVLLYRPEVLILDEPTVGLDPLLRESVWNYLLDLVKSNSTILLTTHYIEETRQSHMVGLMRKGYIIAEAAPDTLLNEFAVDTLEDAFLSLSQLQDKLDDGGKTKFVCQFKKVAGNTICERDFDSNTSSTSLRVKALVWKQFLTMFRNIPLLIFTMMSAAASITLFFLCIGHDPKGIKVAVVNYETNNTICDFLHCHTTQLSCNYIELLRQRFLELDYLTNENKGSHLLQTGDIHAYFVIKPNYTLALRNRIFDTNSIDDKDLAHSTIDVYRDFMAKDVAGYVKKVMVEAFEDLTDLYLDTCNVTTRVMKMPFDWKDPVYGKKDLEMTVMGSPAYLLMASFCVASIATSCSILMERNEGTYDRMFALGVGHVEILISHMVSDLSLVVGQIISALMVAFLVFGLPLSGHLYLVVALAVVNSISGMCFGYAIASILKSESAAMHLLSGSMTPAILLSGTLWPREGMHPILREAAWFLPITQSAHSISSILNRGWGFCKPTVYLGFVNCIVWIVVFLIIAVTFLRYNQK